VLLCQTAGPVSPGSPARVGGSGQHRRRKNALKSKHPSNKTPVHSSGTQSRLELHETKSFADTDAQSTSVRCSLKRSCPLHVISLDPCNYRDRPLFPSRPQLHDPAPATMCLREADSMPKDAEALRSSSGRAGNTHSSPATAAPGARAFCLTDRAGRCRC